MHDAESHIEIRTCDRCYAIKARCFYEAHRPSASCHRCDRLGHSCERKRPVKRNGRPRIHERTSGQLSRLEGLSNIRVGNSDLQILLPPNADHQAPEARLLQFLLYSNEMSRYVYGPAFLGLAKSAVVQQLFKDPENLREGALALAEALMRRGTQNSVVAACDTTTHMVRASRALEVLRNLQPQTFCGVQTAVALALLLLWYNDLNLGQQSLPISRSALLATCAWQSDLVGAAALETDANIISLLFAEIYECLIRREIPVFRYRPPAQDCRIDRHYGICHGLLPYLYDVCELGNQQKRGLLSSDELTEQARQLAIAIKSWIPVEEVSRRMLHALPMEEFEKQHIISQGKIFRSMTLLLVQSLHPNSDTKMRYETALKLRHSILNETQQRPPGPRYLLFPYFVSCLELAPHSISDTTRMHVAKHMEEITNGLAPTSCKSMLAFIDTVWQSRKQTPGLTWFDIADKTPELCIGP